MATPLSQAYKDAPMQLHHITPLDFESVLDLPESHVWTQADKDRDPNVCPSPDKEGHPYTCQDDHKARVEMAPPVIDLQDPDVVDLVGDACRRWGVFQVTGHGVFQGLVDDVEAHVRRLFALPAEQKRKTLRSPSGATGYGVARISPFFSKLMWHEGFTIMGSPLEHAKELWPHCYQEFCDAMEDYQKKMKSLAYNIMIIIFKALGVDEEEQERISSSFLHQSDGALQLNSYPSCPNPSKAIGLPPHTDSLLLTILHQNDTNGLEILHEGVGWVQIRPTPGALVVNIGDLMHIMSNACVPSSIHRVVPTATGHRFTFAYFYGPPADSVVAPLPKLPGLPRFRAVTVKEYVGIKNKHLDKALSMIRI